MHGFERNEAGKVFVGGLSWDTTKDSLLNYFSQYGEVIDCVVMKNPETGKSRGFGFVTYRDPTCVETVLTVPAHIVDGRQVDPKACNPKGPNRGRGEGGGGGGHEGGHRMNRGPRGHESLKDKKIFIGGLPNNADEEAIRNLFSRYGNVVEVTVMYDAQKQRSRGFGFLTFDSEEAVNQVCREHYILFHGKKVECKRATPRDNKGGGGGGGGQEEPQFHPAAHSMPMQHLEVGGHPPQQAPGPIPGPEPTWAPPPEASWNQPGQQGPPQLGGPPQLQNLQFPPGGYQGDQPPQGVQPGAWPPQQPPPHSAGGWPPGGIPPPQQPPTPVSAPFMAPQPTVSQAFSTAPGFQPPAGAPMYQYAALSQQPPPANGQPPPVGQPVPSSYGYAPPSYAAQSAAPAVAATHSAPGLPARAYQEFSNGQVQIATTVAPVQPPTGVPAISATQTYTYPSPYGSPTPQGQAAGSAPAADPYGTPTPVAPPQGAVQVAAPTAAGQPAALPGYGSPIAQTPIPGSADPTSPKAVDYSSYYSAYGYGAETSPSAAAGAYGGQPAPAPYAGQGEAPQAVAYGGAPGPSPPSFQRQGSGAQGYHPYARR